MSNSRNYVTVILFLPLSGRYNHSYIMNTIGRVSSGFQCLARDQSLWKGSVSIDWTDTKSVDYKETLNKAIDSFLGEGAKELEFINVFDRPLKISKQQITAIAEKCPNLEEWRLDFLRLESWPRGPILQGLKVLTIMGRMSTHWDLFKPGVGHYDTDTFHQIFPQLEVFNLIMRWDFNSKFEAVWLPDMTKCEKLKTVAIGGDDSTVKYCIPEHLVESVPFPKSLKFLDLQSTIVNCPKEKISQTMEDWGCKLVLKGGIHLFKQFNRHSSYSQGAFHGVLEGCSATTAQMKSDRNFTV